jgi:hypothetical protein
VRYRQLRFLFRHLSQKMASGTNPLKTATTVSRNPGWGRNLGKGAPLELAKASVGAEY